MGTGWRKAFCTSVPGDPPESPRPLPPHPEEAKSSSTQTLRCRTKSAPSPSLSPRELASSPGPRPSPRTTTTTNNNNNNSYSSPCSPRSPSRFALLKLRLYKQSCCGICLKSTKTSQGTAVLTAECSHAFHFSCIASHVSQRGALVCPVCNARWGPVPLLSDHLRRPPTTQTHGRANATQRGDHAVGAYDDDEPLLTPRCDAIPKAKEEEENVAEESKSESSTDSNRSGLFSSAETIKSGGGVETIVSPCVLPLASGRTHNKYVIALKLMAPPAPTPTSPSRASAGPTGRAPIDLVTVLDVGGGMTGEKLLMLKRAMRLVVSSLRSADRLAVVGASSTAKRLLPLTRMTPKGHRSAHHIVDGLALASGSSVGDALRKATRVLEDRRERNPVATIMLLSDGNRRPPHERPLRRLPTFPEQQQRGSSGTRFAHVEIPVDDEEKEKEEPAGDAFARCVGGLLSVVAQDVRLRLAFYPGDVTAVYACGAQPAVLGVGGESVRLGDLYAEEERELLVEFSAPAVLGRGSLDLRCSYREPGVPEPVCMEASVPASLPGNNQSPFPSVRMECLKNLYVTTRATVEARRLAELGEFGTATRLLSSAESLLTRSACGTAKESLMVLDGVAAEVRGRREERRRRMGPREPLTPSLRRFGEGGLAVVEEEGEEEEALTPTSAWRAAEKLAKVAIVRKSMRRIGELHGFENARF